MSKEPVRQGFLTKQGGSRHRSLGLGTLSKKKRWFVLTDKYLMYFKTEDDFHNKAEPLGQMIVDSLRAISRDDPSDDPTSSSSSSSSSTSSASSQSASTSSSASTDSHNGPYRFDLVSSGRVMHVCTNSERNRRDWIETINLYSKRNSHLSGMKEPARRASEMPPHSPNNYVSYANNAHDTGHSSHAHALHSSHVQLSRGQLSQTVRVASPLSVPYATSSNGTNGGGVKYWNPPGDGGGSSTVGRSGGPPPIVRKASLNQKPPKPRKPPIIRSQTAVFSPSGRNASAAASGATGGHPPHAAVSSMHFERPQSSGGGRDDSSRTARIAPRAVPRRSATPDLSRSLTMTRPVESPRQRPRLQAKTISQTSSLVPPTSPRLQDSRLNSGYSGGASAQAQAQAAAAAAGAGPLALSPRAVTKSAPPSRSASPAPGALGSGGVHHYQQNGASAHGHGHGPVRDLPPAFDAPKHGDAPNFHTGNTPPQSPHNTVTRFATSVSAPPNHKGIRFVSQAPSPNLATHETTHQTQHASSHQHQHHHNGQYAHQQQRSSSYAHQQPPSPKNLPGPARAATLPSHPSHVSYHSQHVSSTQSNVQLSPTTAARAYGHQQHHQQHHHQQQPHHQQQQQHHPVSRVANVPSPPVEMPPPVPPASDDASSSSAHGRNTRESLRRSTSSSSPQLTQTSSPRYGTLHRQGSHARLVSPKLDSASHPPQQQQHSHAATHASSSLSSSSNSHSHASVNSAPNGSGQAKLVRKQAPASYHGAPSMSHSSNAPGAYHSRDYANSTSSISSASSYASSQSNSPMSQGYAPTFSQQQHGHHTQTYPGRSSSPSPQQYPVQSPASNSSTHSTASSSSAAAATGYTQNGIGQPPPRRKSASRHTLNRPPPLTSVPPAPPDQRDRPPSINAPSVPVGPPPAMSMSNASPRNLNARAAPSRFANQSSPATPLPPHSGPSSQHGKLPPRPLNRQKSSKDAFSQKFNFFDQSASQVPDDPWDRSSPPTPVNGAETVMRGGSSLMRTRRASRERKHDKPTSPVGPQSYPSRSPLTIGTVSASAAVAAALSKQHSSGKLPTGSQSVPTSRKNSVVNADRAAGGSGKSKTSANLKAAKDRFSSLLKSKTSASASPSGPHAHHGPDGGGSPAGAAATAHPGAALLARATASSPAATPMKNAPHTTAISTSDYANILGLTSFDPEKEIRVHTCDQLVKMLPKKKLLIFRKAFLLFHNAFIDSTDLMDKLIGLFERAKMDHERVEILLAIGQWFKDYIADFDKPTEEKLLKFLRQEEERAARSTKVRDSVMLLQSDFDAASREHRQSSRIEAQLEDMSCLSSSAYVRLPGQKFVNVRQLAPVDIARAMTVRNWTLYSKMRAREFENHAWMKPKLREQCSPNILRVVNEFNETSRWVASEILRLSDRKARTELVQHFLLVAAECRALSNYHGLFVIMTGLSLGPVYRLKSTWNGLSRKARNNFSDLKSMLNSDGNYANYRQELQIKSTSTPSVPHLAIITKDYLALDSIESPELGPGKIDFSKYTKLYACLHPLFQSQRLAYEFAIDHESDRAIDEHSRAPTLSEDDMYSHSYEYCPRT